MPTAKDLTRFLSYVDASVLGGCWEWQGSLRESTGYGCFWLNGKTESAHRISISWLGDGIDGPSIRHTCDNRRCVNPAHLESGTHQDNMRDMAERGRAAQGDQNSKRVMSKIGHEGVQRMRDLAKAGYSQRAIGRIIGCSQGHVSASLAGKRWGK